MSLKPLKKSDLDKSWMKSRRDKPKKIQPEYHLIITEGAETEPAYFKAMKEIINSTYSDRIQIGVHGAEDNTLSLFQKAKNMAESSANGYKHVCSQIYTEHPTGQSLQKYLHLSDMGHMKRIVPICTRFSFHIWMQQLLTQKSLIKSMKENFHQPLLPEPKYTNL